MTLEQTVEIPEDHRIQVFFDIPYNVPAGRRVKVALDLPQEEKPKNGNWRSLCGCLKDSTWTAADFLEDKHWNNLVEEIRDADEYGFEIPPIVLEKAKEYGWTIEELRNGKLR